jgi:hypothetical protein
MKQPESEFAMEVNSAPVFRASPIGNLVRHRIEFIGVLMRFRCMCSTNTDYGLHESVGQLPMTLPIRTMLTGSRS